MCITQLEDALILLVILTLDDTHLTINHLNTINSEKKFRFAKV